MIRKTFFLFPKSGFSRWWQCWWKYQKKKDIFYVYYHHHLLAEENDDDWPLFAIFCPILVLTSQNNIRFGPFARWRKGKPLPFNWSFSSTHLTHWPTLFLYLVFLKLSFSFLVDSDQWTIDAPQMNSIVFLRFLLL